MNLMAPTITLAIILSLMMSAAQPKSHINIKKKMMMMFMVSLIPLNIMLDNNEMTLTSTPLINMATENISISITLDSLSITFIPVSLFVTWSILEFSTWYMNSDPNLNKFIKYLLLFLIAMLIIITANNIYQLFIGWEAVGVMSFLLINWWNGRSEANTAALQAIIYNRIGDIGLISTTAWLMSTSSLNVQELLMMKTNIIPMIGLVAAAMGKSAQFGLHPWLPSAMEGPTPVSALLHSSTMVVAGVFLLIRFNQILQNHKSIMTICLILGATTTVFAAASATTHSDIKKIIALSTTSQLGLMMTMVGLNYPMLAFLHMITHSFFKALLFLCSGTMIHNLQNEQDTRTMGGLLKTMPATSSFLVIACLSLMGMPFLSGFYSKDTMIETMLNSHTNSWAITITMLATVLSASYSTKIILLTLTGYPRTKPTTHYETKDAITPMMRLAMMSIFIGTSTKMLTLQNTTTTSMPAVIKLAALLASLMGITLSKDIHFTSNYLAPKKQKTLNSFLNQLAFFNLPHRAVPTGTLKFSQHTSTELMDLWALENYGPHGLSNLTVPMIHLSTQQKNMIKNYLTTFTMTVIILIPPLLSKWP